MKNLVLLYHALYYVLGILFASPRPPLNPNDILCMIILPKLFTIPDGYSPFILYQILPFFFLIMQVFLI